MAVYYAVNRYLSDCELPHDVITEQPRAVPYNELKDLARVARHMDPSIAQCSLEEFRSLIYQTTHYRPTVGRLSLAIMYAMLCAEFLISQGEENTIPEIIAVAHNAVSDGLNPDSWSKPAYLKK